MASNPVTNYMSLSTSDFLGFAEALQTLVATTKHSFTFPRDGDNSVLWTRPYNYQVWDMDKYFATAGYGMSEKELNAFISDVQRFAEEITDGK